jgi:fumarate hydratase subunit alpha
MKTIHYAQIVDAVKELCISTNISLAYDSEQMLHTALGSERSPLAQSILRQCIKNAELARSETIPICQDTGLAVFFIQMGNDICIKDGLLNDAIHEGVRVGYREGHLRASVLTDPVFDRKNTGDNTPAIIHLEIIKGDTLTICITPKGGGAENMSALAMLPPSAGEIGIIRFVAHTVINAGGNPCPPVVVGVGIGGNFERCAYLAKKALLRPLGTTHSDNRYAELEKKILKEINSSGIGPQGLGGDTTAFAVHIEYEPCHLASLPVAVNINCHVHRHQTIVL